MELLEQGYTLITASNRLARRLKHQYARYQLEKGNPAWESPEILPWQAWLQQCWQQYSRQNPQLSLLNSIQEQVLWQQIISRSVYADKLLHQAAVAKRASRAWELINAYQIPVFPEGVYVSEDAFAFKLWTEAFQKECMTKSWLDMARLPSVLVEYYQTNECPAGKFALMGFDELTPQQQYLFSTLKNKGATVKYISSLERNQSIAINGYADVVEEIKAAANWARLILQDNPDNNIGIIVLKLGSIRGQIISAFENCLVPSNLIDNTKNNNVPFSFFILLSFS